MTQSKYEYLMVIGPLSEEDGGGFIARVPDLPGCFGDGETYETALHDAQKAIVEWVDEYEKMGREVPVPGSAATAARKRRDEEHQIISALLDRLRASEQNWEGLDERIETLERDVKLLLELMDNEEAWERFHIITRTTRKEQQDLFC